MPAVGFETTITASERPQTYALDHSATGIGLTFIHYTKYSEIRQSKPKIYIKVKISLRRTYNYTW